MTVRLFQSTDVSAPVLTNAVGSLTNLLDAVLVSGYGAKAPLGWAIEFTGANKRIYRPPLGLMRPRLRIQDDGLARPAPFNTGGEARFYGAEGATTVDAVTGKYPQTAASTCVFQKSTNALATPWIVLGDERTMYMFAQSGDYASGWASMCFGEYYSLKSTPDNFNSIIIGNITETLTASPVQSVANENLPKLAALTAVAAGHFVPRGWGEQGPLTTNYGVGKHGHGGHSSVGLVGLVPYPNPFDNGIHLSQVWIHEPMGLALIRGRMRGFWHCLHPASTLKHGDTWSGTGSLAGKTFMAISPVPDGLGAFVMETSNTWETN